MTKEQVARALNVICAQWLRRRRGSGLVAYVASTLRYHQARNAAAMRARGKPELTCLAL